MNINEMIQAAIANNYVVESVIIPELGMYKKGKVGDNFIDDNKIVVIRSDRISSFDIVSSELIPFKGEALTEIAYHAFKETEHKVPNAVISHPDPNILVQENIKNTGVEWIVRDYFTGSLWRDYAKGNREFKWFTLPDGLKQYQKFDELMFTPTNKAEKGHDENISVEEIVEKKLCTKEQLAQIKEYCFELFKIGSESASKQGLILVDTKYEFGFNNIGEPKLIDEVHTLDSSRFWYKKDYDAKIAIGKAPDEKSKELARDIFREEGYKEGDNTLPLIKGKRVNVSELYIEMCKARTGIEIKYDPATTIGIKNRILTNLRKAGLAEGVLAVILAASDKDKEHYDKIASKLKEVKIPYVIPAPASAHKDTKKVLETLDFYNKSMEPLVYIAVAGRSNALGPMAAGNTKFPVISCPAFSDAATMQMDIWSSLRMPSNLAMSVVLDPGNAALQAKKILDLTR